MALCPALRHAFPGERPDRAICGPVHPWAAGEDYCPRLDVPVDVRYNVSDIYLRCVIHIGPACREKGSDRRLRRGAADSAGTPAASRMTAGFEDRSPVGYQ